MKKRHKQQSNNSNGSEKKYKIRVDDEKTDKNGLPRIYLDDKQLLRKSEILKTVKQTFIKSKGSGTEKNRHKINKKAVGISRRTTNRALKSLAVYQNTRPVFDNKAPLRPIKAIKVHERHQIDLVDFMRQPAKYHGIEYKYVLSVLDVFSRYLSLRSLKAKSSKYVARALNDIYTSEGYPNIIQCDNGLEFHGYVKRLCEKK